MEGGDSSSGREEVEVLPARDPSSNVVGFLKKLGARSIAWLGVYLLGYFGFSVSWMLTPLILSALRDQWKKEKRQRLAAARESALSNEQAIIESRMLVDELPSWVYFPDRERAEWLNSIIKQLWPNVNNYVRTLLFETVEPLVRTTLEGFKLSGFKFERERVYLGQVPPRITGVKVYDEKHTSRHQIVMDVDLVYASDLEVVFSLKGISARISEFSLRGMLRVVFKPLISDIPLIGGIQVYFLRDPEIDYSLGGVAGALDIPGLNKIVERLVLEQIRNFIVLPNKISVPLAANLPIKELKCPSTAGVLRVTLIKAKELMQKDVKLLGKGSSDPYAILTVGATTHKTPTRSGTCNPIWETTYDFPIEVVQGQQFMMEFFDEDDNRDDEFLGRATVQTSVVAERGHIEGLWVDLEECQSGKAKVSLSWLAVTSDPEAVRQASKMTQPGDETAKCLVHVYIDSCSGLQDAKNPAYKPSPMVQLVCAKDVRQSWPKYYTTDPVIEQGYVMLIRSPQSDDIHVRVLDTNKNNKVIASTTIHIWSIIQEPNMEFPLQPWNLKGSSPDGKISLSVSIRGLMAPATSPRPTDRGEIGIPGGSAAGGQEQGPQQGVPRGRLKLFIQRAVELEKKDVGGKSDPYCLIQYGSQTHQTKVCKNTISPEWNQEFTLEVEEDGDTKVRIQVFDKDKIGKDEALGETILDLRNILKLGRVEDMWEVLSNCESGKLLLSARFNRLPPVQDLTLADDAVDRKDILPPSPTCSSPALQEPEEASPAHQVVMQDPVVPNLQLEDIRDDDEHEEEQEEDVEAKNEDTGTEVQTVLHEPPFHEDVPTYMYSMTSGFLKVTVHRGIDLEKKDITGKSDPYVVVCYDGQRDKSKHFKNTLTPEFEFQTGFVTEEKGPSEIRFEVWDQDIGKDEPMGHAAFDLTKVIEEGRVIRYWLPLVDCKSGRLLVSLEFNQTDETVPLEDVRRPSENNIIAAAISPAIKLAAPEGHLDPVVLDGLRRRPVGTNGRIRLTLIFDARVEELKIFVHEAAGLPGGELPDPPDPYVKLYLMPGKKKKRKTQVVKDSGSPRWDEEFDVELEHKHLPNHALKVMVVDKKGVFHRSPVLGTVTIPLDNPGILQGVADWFPLEHSDEDSE